MNGIEKKKQGKVDIKHNINEKSQYFICADDINNLLRHCHKNVRFYFGISVGQYYHEEEDAEAQIRCVQHIREAYAKFLQELVKNERLETKIRIDWPIDFIVADSLQVLKNNGAPGKINFLKPNGECIDFIMLHDEAKIEAEKKLIEQGKTIEGQYRRLLSHQLQQHQKDVVINLTAENGTYRWSEMKHVYKDKLFVEAVNYLELCFKYGVRKNITDTTDINVGELAYALCEIVMNNYLFSDLNLHRETEQAFMFYPGPLDILRFGKDLLRLCFSEFKLDSECFELQARDKRLCTTKDSDSMKYFSSDRPEDRDGHAVKYINRILGEQLKDKISRLYTSKSSEIISGQYCPILSSSKLRSSAHEEDQLTNEYDPLSAEVTDLENIAVQMVQFHQDNVKMKEYATKMCGLHSISTLASRFLELLTTDSTMPYRSERLCCLTKDENEMLLEKYKNLFLRKFDEKECEFLQKYVQKKLYTEDHTDSKTDFERKDINSERFIRWLIWDIDHTESNKCLLLVAARLESLGLFKLSQKIYIMLLKNEFEPLAQLANLWRIKDLGEDEFYKQVGPYIIGFSKEFVGNNPRSNRGHKEYSLCFMSELLHGDPNNADNGKIYLSEEGYYYVRDPMGVVQKASFKEYHSIKFNTSNDLVGSSEKRGANSDEVLGKHGLFTHLKKNSSEQKALFEQAIPAGFSLSEAKGKGDCFYDSYAQELNELSGENEYTIKSLRLLCHDYAVELDRQCDANPQHPDNWIAKALNYDIRKYQEYLANVPYTVEEREAGVGVGNDKLAVWGEQHIDGRILCEKFNVRLHVIEVRENPDDQTNKTQPFMSSHNLVNENGLRNVENESINWDDKNTLHIAVCNLHFVPILRKIPMQSSAPDFIVPHGNKNNSDKGKEELDEIDSNTLKAHCDKGLKEKLEDNNFKDFILTLALKRGHIIMDKLLYVMLHRILTVVDNANKNDKNSKIPILSAIVKSVEISESDSLELTRLYVANHIQKNKGGSLNAALFITKCLMHKYIKCTIDYPASLIVCLMLEHLYMQSKNDETENIVIGRLSSYCKEFSDDILIQATLAYLKVQSLFVDEPDDVDFRENKKVKKLIDVYDLINRCKLDPELDPEYKKKVTEYFGERLYNLFVQLKCYSRDLNIPEYCGIAQDFLEKSASLLYYPAVITREAISNHDKSHVEVSVVVEVTRAVSSENEGGASSESSENEVSEESLRSPLDHEIITNIICSYEKALELAMQKLDEASFKAKLIEFEMFINNSGKSLLKNLDRYSRIYKRYTNSSSELTFDKYWVRDSELACNIDYINKYKQLQQSPPGYFSYGYKRLFNQLPKYNTLLVLSMLWDISDSKEKEGYRQELARLLKSRFSFGEPNDERDDDDKNVVHSSIDVVHFLTDHYILLRNKEYNLAKIFFSCLRKIFDDPIDIAICDRDKLKIKILAGIYSGLIENNIKLCKESLCQEFQSVTCCGRLEVMQGCGEALFWIKETGLVKNDTYDSMMSIIEERFENIHKSEECESRGSGAFSFLEN